MWLSKSDEPFRFGVEKETSLWGLRGPLVDSDAKEETEERRRQEDRSVTTGSTLRARAPTGSERRRISVRMSPPFTFTFVCFGVLEKCCGGLEGSGQTLPNRTSFSSSCGGSGKRDTTLGWWASEVLVLKHESRTLGQWYNAVSGSRKSQDQTAQSLTCSIMEILHIGLDACPRVLLSCFTAINYDEHP